MIFTQFYPWVKPTILPTFTQFYPTGFTQWVKRTMPTLVDNDENNHIQTTESTQAKGSTMMKTITYRQLSQPKPSGQQ